MQSTGVPVFESTALITRFNQNATTVLPPSMAQNQARNNPYPLNNLTHANLPLVLNNQNPIRNQNNPNQFVNQNYLGTQSSINTHNPNLTTVNIQGNLSNPSDRNLWINQLMERGCSQQNAILIANSSRSLDEAISYLRNNPY